MCSFIAPLVCRVMSSVIKVAKTAIPGGVLSDITSTTVGRALLSPASHAKLLCLKYGSIWIIRSEFGVEEREVFF